MNNCSTYSHALLYNIIPINSYNMQSDCFHRESRRCLLKMHMKETVTLLSENDWKCLEDLTEGYSGSDISNFVADAVLQPIREIEKALYWKRSGSNHAVMIENVFFVYMK